MTEPRKTVDNVVPVTNLRLNFREGTVYKHLQGSSMLSSLKNPLNKTHGSNRIQINTF